MEVEVKGNGLVGRHKWGEKGQNKGVRVPLVVRVYSLGTELMA